MNTSGGAITYALSTAETTLFITAWSTNMAFDTHDGPPGAVVGAAVIANFSTIPAYVRPVRFETMRESR